MKKEDAFFNALTLQYLNDIEIAPRAVIPLLSHLHMFNNINNFLSKKQEI